MKKKKILIKTLVYGFGNDQKHDFGLGKEMVSRLNTWISDNYIFDVDLKTSLDLSLEEAESLAKYKRIIFVEGSQNSKTCDLKKIKAGRKHKTHSDKSYTPQDLINECGKKYRSKPQAYHLSIGGTDWSFEEGLSEFASMNLDKAELFLKEILRNSVFQKPIFENFKIKSV